MWSTSAPMLKMGVAYSCFEPMAGLFGIGPLRTAIPGVRRHAAIAYSGGTVSPREVDTRRSLKQLQNVKNIRDLAEASPIIQPGRVFRSACPNTATAADIEILREQLHVNHLIDLRSTLERREDSDSLLLRDAEIINSLKRGMVAERETYRMRSDDSASNSTVSVASTGMPQIGKSALDVRKVERFNSIASEGASARDDATANGSAHGSDDSDSEQLGPKPTLTVHHVGLLEKNRYLRSLLTRLPRGQAALTVMTSFISLRKAKSVVLREVNRGGLPMLYEILLDSSARELCTVLKIILKAAERGETTLFFCRIGKDRTGLTAALLLAACGATEEEIISDYARSDGQDGVALGGYEKELEGLDRQAFSAAPPDAMAKCLEYVKVAYGGMTQYLDHIGFGEDERERLKAALSGDRDLPGADVLNAELRRGKQS